ncbi:MAG TPA: superoxide dismutase family protein [Geminicoccaceae bacterium]|nr:superoxide dismutase family protein [Geminicoccaceae bacterium]
MRGTLAAMAAAGCLAISQAQAQESVNAVLINPDGEEIGTVAISEIAQGLRIFAQAEDLPPGVHAFHIHETGQCDTPSFESAGGHYNPTGMQHGWDNPEGPHAGDFPNVHVHEDGKLAVEYFTAALTLSGGENTLFDDDGSAVVVHEGPDDYQSDPAGHAGARIACGVISR